jgi:predicted O-methyltransferase YrrM
MAARTPIPHFYTTVPGWANFTQIYLDAIAEAQPHDALVEVGCWEGRSAAYMAVEILNSGKDLAFYCCDTWTGSESPRWMKDVVARNGGSLYGAFQAHMQRGGVWEHLRVLEMPSVKAAAQFGDGTVRFVFLDGDHTYDAVRADVVAWLPKVQPGGVLAGDDANWSGVLPAVYELLPASEVELLNHEANWRYRKTRPERGFWVMADDLPATVDTFAYIGHVNRLDLTMDAVESLADLWPTLVVVDQSPEGLPPLTMQELRGKANVFRMPYGAQTFCQVQNWALAEACARHAQTLLWMHNDASCPPGTATQLLAHLQAQPAVGLLFTNYDALCVFRMAAVAQAGVWDETFQWYFSDTDMYRRLRLAGWQTPSVLATQVQHTPSQTLAADPALRQARMASAAWTQAHYCHKWGGDPGRERYTIPYNGHCRPEEPWLPPH